MTTSIKVVTHDWPVQVQNIDITTEGEQVSGTTEVVEPHSERTFNIHQHRELHIKELPIQTATEQQEAA